MSKIRKFLTKPGIYFRDYLLKKHPLAAGPRAPTFKAVQRNAAPAASERPVPALPYSTPRQAAAALALNISPGIDEGFEYYDFHKSSLPWLVETLGFFSRQGFVTRYYENGRFHALGKDPINEAMAMSALKRVHLVVSTPDKALVETFALRIWADNLKGLSNRDDHAPVRFDPGKTYAKEGLPTDLSFPFAVDAVFTWVDSSDESWRQEIARFKNLNDIDLDRYVSNDELKYSIRSVRLNAPWIRKIFILSNCAPPAWFKPGPDAAWVYHAEVADPETLPLFNSHAIEALLPEIPGLSDHFIYLNDDFFIMEPVQKSDFFTFDGKSKSRLEPYGRVVEFLNRDTAGLEEWQKAAANGAELILRDYGFLPTRLHQHVPYSFNRNTFQKLMTQYSRELSETKASRFRSSTDFSVTSFLYHHYAIAIGEGQATTASQFLVRQRNYKSFEQKLKTGVTYKYICMNDGEGSHADHDFQAGKRRILERLFPFYPSSETPSPLSSGVPPNSNI